ncbi:unnamed protein product [Zymoseptoria tritici ST99CH_3D1]|uniref:Chitin-binding type-1 domain-containing protein n=1 Tax=Zymoseptoria tritici (strain ST99CH_3D7) TaxID=1276538 RepID=A0A1X7RMB1_ZYMT9|nr:unnamed protein product [Zymoseptoria tritici ST99CH_3D7]SMR49363.1 unnamed protein product [Zymoseptoria tritici ST99CH_3D1]
MHIFAIFVLLGMVVAENAVEPVPETCAQSCFYGGPGNPYRCQAADCKTYTCNDAAKCGGQNDICRPDGFGTAYCHDVPRVD